VNIHWYWPYSHAGTNPLVAEALRPGDSVVVQALSTRFGAPINAMTDYEVIRNLPETGGVVPSRRNLRWAFSRALIYRQRALARQRILETRSFDVSCQYHLNPFSDWRYLPKTPNRTALVSVVHDVIPHERRAPQRLERALLQRTYTAAGELVVFHRVLKSMLLDQFDLNEDRVHVIRHPLYPPGGHVHPPEVTNDLRALFFGAFRENKGLSVLIEAARLLGDDSHIKFHIAGRGNPNLETLVRSAAHKLPNLTCDIGYASVGQVRDLFRSSHIVILPYTSMTSQSGVLADAYANAVPVIVSNVGAIGETVREDGTGIVVDPGNPSALAAAIGSIAAQPWLIQEFSGAIHAAAKNYAHDAVGSSLRAIFQLVANRRQG
jgi:glycosyltransferase involved in cell wall biosynthesis